MMSLTIINYIKNIYNGRLYLYIFLNYKLFCPLQILNLSTPVILQLWKNTEMIV